MTPSSHPEVRPLGIVINPSSGRDARRLFARADSSTLQSKRNQVERIIVGAAASGVHSTYHRLPSGPSGNNKQRFHSMVTEQPL